MYDMYPWDSRADGSRTRTPEPRNGDASHASGPSRGSRNQTPNGSQNGTPDGSPSAPDPATQAVHFALDRRDNGGATAEPGRRAAATATVAGQ